MMTLQKLLGGRLFYKIATTLSLPLFTRRHCSARVARASLSQWLCLSAVCLLGGCALYTPADTSDTTADTPSDNLRTVLWGDIVGWNEDSHAETIPVFLRSCPKLKEKWHKACDAAAALPENVSDKAAREFFETYFLPYQLHDKDGGDSGLITGYYEPLLRGDKKPSSRYPYPIYTRPGSMLQVDLSELYPSLADQRVRGRLKNGRVIPYYSRAEIDVENSPLAGDELLWVEDKVALFFLHIQGSGLVLLPSNEIIGVGYADQNGHPYRSIGRLLVERGEMELADVNLFSIREWLKNNPSRADELLYDNPSYVFFTQRKKVDIGPIGSLGVILTPKRSLAIDPSVIPPGAPVWLNAASPDDDAPPLAQLMMAQDTGGAIRGDIRADVFWGRGQEAETMAGLMKSRGQLFVLLPR